MGLFNSSEPVRTIVQHGKPSLRLNLTGVRGGSVPVRSIVQHWKPSMRLNLTGVRGGLTFLNLFEPLSSRGNKDHRIGHPCTGPLLLSLSSCSDNQWVQKRHSFCQPQSVWKWLFWNPVWAKRSAASSTQSTTLISSSVSASATYNSKITTMWST